MYARALNLYDWVSFSGTEFKEWLVSIKPSSRHYVNQAKKINGLELNFLVLPCVFNSDSYQYIRIGKSSCIALFMKAALHAIRQLNCNNQLVEIGEPISPN